MTASAAGGADAPSAEAIFLDYASHSREDVRGVFERYDADGDGRLSGVEMRNMLRDVGLVSAFDTAEDCAFLKKQLIAADRDGDGAVGFEEFTVYLNTVAAPRARSTKPRGNTAGGTKISFFAENDLFVADPRVSAHSRVTETEIAAASPGTPELTAERGRRDVSRHGTRSRIPTPPPSYSKSSSKRSSTSKTSSWSPRASPGTATRFGFANSPSSTPSSSAFETSLKRSQSQTSRLASRLSMTPGTPRAGFSTLKRLETSTSSKPSKPSKTEDASSFDASASLPETPSPLPAFAGPSRVRDATNDLVAFVRNLELETKDLSVPKDGSVESTPRAAPPYDVSAAVVPEAAPRSSRSSRSSKPSKPSKPSSVEPVSVESSIESALETFEAAAANAAPEAANGGARPDGDSDVGDVSDADSAVSGKAANRVCVSRVSSRIATRSNAATSNSARVRSQQTVSAAVRAFAERAARYVVCVVCLALLFLAAAAFRDETALAFFFRRARAGGSGFLETLETLETCPAPSPITAARRRERFISIQTKTSGSFRLEPNVILPRDSFPATETWTF